MPETAVRIPVLMTVDEVAALLGTGRRFVYRLTHERRIAFSHQGRELRFRDVDVRDYIDANTHPMAPDAALPPRRPGRPRTPVRATRRPNRLHAVSQTSDRTTSRNPDRKGAQPSW